MRTFDVQHVQGNGKFAFAFVEGPLVKALRMGHWYVTLFVHSLTPHLGMHAGSYLMRSISLAQKRSSVSRACSTARLLPSP